MKRGLSFWNSTTDEMVMRRKSRKIVAAQLSDTPSAPSRFRTPRLPGAGSASRETATRHRGRADAPARTADRMALAETCGRFGYGPRSAPLRATAWRVNAKRIEWISRREGLKLPVRQPERGFVRDNNGVCANLRPHDPDHCWS